MALEKRDVSGMSSPQSRIKPTQHPFWTRLKWWWRGRPFMPSPFSRNFWNAQQYALRHLTFVKEIVAHFNFVDYQLKGGLLQNFPMFSDFPGMIAHHTRCRWCSGKKQDGHRWVICEMLPWVTREPYWTDVVEVAKHQARMMLE